MAYNPDDDPWASPKHDCADEDDPWAIAARNQEKNEQEQITSQTKQMSLKSDGDSVADQELLQNSKVPDGGSRNNGFLNAFGGFAPPAADSLGAKCDSSEANGSSSYSFWSDAAAKNNEFRPSGQEGDCDFDISGRHFYKNGSLRSSARQFSQETSGEEPAWAIPSEDVDKPMSREEISLLNKILHKKLEIIQHDNVQVSLQQSDPSSPLYSANTFESLRLKEELLKALQRMGFQMPSKIQEAALPLLLIEPPQNMIAQSQSGTGKTAAFVLTMLSRVVPENKWPQCLCLAPTYELAMQIGQVVKEMSYFMPEVKVQFAVRGVQVTRGTHIEEQIVIGTPGKMLDWVLKLKLIDASKIICLVFDEADVMISQQGYQDQSLRLHRELVRSGAKYQSLLFSATYEEKVFDFAETIIKDPVIITVRREEQTLANIKQYYVKCANREEKYNAVKNLYGGLTIASAIIFCYTRKSAEWLAARMREKDHVVALLHGEMTIEERARVIREFKDGEYKILITTNVCARGIDASQVTIVINYDPPVTFSEDPQPDYETYLHRIGRTGRFGKAGIAINFASDQFSLDVIHKFEEHFGRKILPLDANDMDQVEAIESGAY